MAVNDIQRTLQSPLQTYLLERLACLNNRESKPVMISLAIERHAVIEKQKPNEHGWKNVLQTNGSACHAKAGVMIVLTLKEIRASYHL